MEGNQTNIRTLFSTAKNLRAKLDSLESTSAVYQENLQRALQSLERCRQASEHVSLFSPNETQDDVASGDLEYLIIDYYIGELIPKQTAPPRKALLQQAQEAYERYLKRLDSYDILSKSDQKLYEKYLNDPAAFALLPTADISARRNTKISRFKQETSLKQKLEYLSQTPSALQNDDATLRELRFAEIQLSTHLAFHALDQIAQELKLLALAPPTPPPGPEALENDYRERVRSNGSGGRNGAAYSERLDPSYLTQSGGKGGPILTKEGKPLQPFTLLDSRQRLRDGVFGPDHSLPTMTIDEYLAEEKRRGGIIDGGGDQSGGGQQAVVDEDDLAKADEETMKARAWDDFTESNPKGSGNTLNRG